MQLVGDRQDVDARSVRQDSDVLVRRANHTTEARKLFAKDVYCLDARIETHSDFIGDVDGASRV